MDEKDTDHSMFADFLSSLGTDGPTDDNDWCAFVSEVAFQLADRSAKASLVWAVNCDILSERQTSREGGQGRNSSVASCG